MRLTYRCESTGRALATATNLLPRTRAIFAQQSIALRRTLHRACRTLHRACRTLHLCACRTLHRACRTLHRGTLYRTRPSSYSQPLLYALRPQCSPLSAPISHPSAIRPRPLGAFATGGCTDGPCHAMRMPAGDAALPVTGQPSALLHAVAGARCMLRLPRCMLRLPRCMLRLPRCICSVACRCRCPSVGDLKAVRIGHDNGGAGTSAHQ